MAADLYKNVMDTEQIDQAARFEALVVTYRKEATTPKGKATVAGCMDWLDYCGTLDRSTIPTLDGYHAWKAKK